MYKIFAKPTFLGKKVVFLPQCHSTNDELARLARNKKIPEGTVIYTDHQISGKGQRGNEWFDKPGENVLLSLLLKPRFLSVQKQFYLNLATGLSILDLLKSYVPGKQVKLKWPNDVYIESKKVSGILIENILRGSSIEWSVNGIGLNLNQEDDLPQNATSVFVESGSKVDRLDFIDELVYWIEVWYRKLIDGSFNDVLDSYHETLYWINEVHIFKAQGREFRGTIKGIDSTGRLIIATSTIERVFGIKEVQFIE